MYMAGGPDKCIFWGSVDKCIWLGDLRSVYSGEIPRNVCTYMAGRPEEGIFCGSPKEWIQRVGRRNIYFWGNSKSGLLRSYST
jgi:hypothetical protein